MRTLPGQMTRNRAIRRAYCLVLVLCALAMCLLATPCAYADETHSQVANSSETAKEKTLGLPGMVPITADQVREGTYDIQVESSSSFFKITEAKLVVEGDSMYAVLTMYSASYSLVYMGTGEQAALAPADDYISFDKGSYTFTVPVSALDANIDCAAFSKSRKKWYDRKIMFYAATLPADALLVELPEYGDPKDAEARSTSQTATAISNGTAGTGEGEPVSVDMPDGEYSVEVNMTGGSGRASVSSPTWLVVQDGKAYARLLWSSTYYDYMIVDDEKYLNLTEDGGNSTFLIPITAFDREMVVIADTTAMGDPVEIEYHLTFYSETIGDKDLIPQEAAIKVLVLAIVVIVVGGILNHVLKKRRRQ